MALTNCPKISFNTYNKPSPAVRPPIDLATANTRHSTNLSQQDETPNHIPPKTRKNIFSHLPSLPPVEPLSELERMAVKIVTSDEGNEDLKKSQRFFESHKQLRTYASEEKLAKRRLPRRRKIFQKGEGNSRVSEGVRMENGNTTSLPKLNELKNSIYVQKESLPKQTGTRIHSTSQTFFLKQPVRTASPNRITFSYISNQPSVCIPHQHSHSQMPVLQYTSHLPMSHNAKASFLRTDHRDVIVRPFAPLCSQDQNGHHNPATAKIKKAEHSMKVSIIPQEPDKASWGKRIKTSLIECSKPRQEILSKISLNICRESTARVKDSNYLNDSNLFLENNQRYFDDDEAFPTRDKLSYRNIEIEKQEEEQREEEMAPHNYLFIDFENSRRNDPDKQEIPTPSQREVVVSPHPILEQSTLVIPEKTGVSRIKQTSFPVVLILLAGLLLAIQIWA